jgi:hypothetical protein
VRPVAESSTSRKDSNVIRLPRSSPATLPDDRKPPFAKTR